MKKSDLVTSFDGTIRFLFFSVAITFHQIYSEDDLRLFESWATETYFRRCEEEPQSVNTQLENLKVWDRICTTNVYEFTF